MLQLESIQVYNWGYAPYQMPLPIGHLTLMRGPNGSGKSTYLNAIALILGAARLPSAQIDHHIYPQGSTWAYIRAVASNCPDVRGRRPFEKVVATFEDTVTLACVLRLRGGSWERTYYIVPGDTFFPDPNTKHGREHQCSLERYQNMLYHLGVRKALLNLLELGLNGINEYARDGQRLFDFCMRLVGNDAIRQKYLDAREGWQQHMRQVSQLQERKRQDERMLGELGEQIAVLRKRRDLEGKQERYQRFVIHARLKQARDKLTTALDAYQIASEAFALYQTEHTEQQRIVEGIEQDHRDWSSRNAAWKRSRDAAFTDRDHAKGASDNAELLWRQHQEYVSQLRLLEAPPLNIAQANYDLADQTYNDARVRFTLHKDNLRTKREEEKGLLQQKRTLPSRVETLLAILKKEHIPHVLLADTVIINDDRWTHAVEGALGSERYTVVVDDELQLVHAMELASEARYRFYVSPDNRKVGQPTVPNSLWDVVTITDQRVQGWVFDVLHRIQRVENIAIGRGLGRKGTSTITPDAFLQTWRGGHSVYPDFLVCGPAVWKRQLAMVREQLVTLVIVYEEARHVLDEARDARALAITMLDKATRRAELPQEEARLIEIETSYQQAAEVFREVDAHYQALKAQEEQWDRERDERARSREGAQGRLEQLTRLVKQHNEKMTRNDVLTHQRTVHEIEAMLPDLSDEERSIYERDQLSENVYIRRTDEVQQEIAGLPSIDFEDLDEALYEQQRVAFEALTAEIETMYARQQQYHELYDQAADDFRQHIQELFGSAMHRAFRQLCEKADAKGEVRVVDDGGERWELHIHVGFNGKPKRPLKDGHLSEGQGVLTALMVVLAALRAMGAEPILLLDELFAKLDAGKTEHVMLWLRDIGPQCFVATPHRYPRTDAMADAIWQFTTIEAGKVHASAVAYIRGTRMQLSENGGSGDQ